MVYSCGMKRPQKGSTIKQYAYATRKLGGQGSSKKEIALLSGFSRSVANNVKAKIEDTEGYQNAIATLAVESNNLLLSVLAQFKARGLQEFSNKDLVSALNAITGAWTKIEEKRAPAQLKTPEGNRLRSIFTERTRTVTLEPTPPGSASASETIIDIPVKEEDIDL
jgi:hypothetical protein